MTRLSGSEGPVDELINWCGFFGAWLLVGGPLAQGARELLEEDLERDALVRVAKGVDKPKPISPWWWMLPPVRYLMELRRSRAYRNAVINEMSAKQVRAFRSYSEKANVWLAVSLGALLIATKETWELVEVYEWPEITFWLLIVFMASLAVANTIFRMRRWHERDQPESIGPESNATADTPLD